MKYMKKIIFLAGLTMSVVSYGADQVLRFATEATYPPFEFMDAKGQVQGFDADLLQAVCQAAKQQCTLVNQPFDSLIPSLKLGKFDGLIGALAITPERQQQVSFSTPYYQTTAVLVAPKAKQFAPNAEGIKGKIVGVQGSTALQFYLEGVYGNAVTVKSYPSEMQAFLDLKAGRVDAVLADTPLGDSWIKQQNGAYVALGQPIVDEKYFGPGFGIAVNKNNQALLQQLNAGLATVKADGTLDKLIQKYFENQQ